MDSGADQALLERDAELATLKRLAAEAGQDGRLGVIVGEAGIGKTALLRAARQVTAAKGMDTLSARGAELEQELPFGLVRQLIEPVLLARTGVERDSLFSDSAALARPLFLTPLAAPAGPPSPEVDYGTLHGLYWLIATLARERPLALVIDDLHWSDPPSLRFLSFLLRRIDGLPILVLAALRPPRDGPAADIIDMPGAITLRPRPLSEGAVGELVRGRLGERAPKGLEHDFSRVCGGIPLYVLALLEELHDDPAARLPELDSIGPTGVVRSVGRRLVALGPDAEALAEAVAVLGDASDLRHAAVIAGLSEGSASTAAHLLTGAAIFGRGPQLSFAHPIVRAAVYERPDPARRAGLHARAAQVLESAGAGPEAVALQLLHAPAGADEWAAARLRTAADLAIGRGAPEIAAAFLTRALAEPLDTHERVEVLVTAGQAEARAGIALAIDHLDEARRMATDPRQRTDAALALARTLYAFGRANESVEILHGEAGALRETAPDQAAELDEELAAVADVDLVARQVVRGLRPKGLGPEHESDTPIMCVHQAVARLMSGDGGERAADLAERGLREGQLEREAAAGGMVYFMAAFVLTVADRFEASEYWLSQALTDAQARGAPLAFAVAATQRAFVRFRRGALTDADADARAALEAAKVNVWPPIAQMALTPLIDVLIERGEPELAYDAARAYGVDLGEIPETTQGNVLLDARGRLRIAAGDVQEGIADLLRVGAQLRSWGVVSPGPFAWRSGAGVALARAGDADTAAELIREELALARRWGTPRSVGAALCAAGHLETGEHQIATFTSAVETLQASGAELELAKAFTLLGAALRRANRRAESRAPLTRGLELALSCGSPALAAQAHTELRAAGGRPRTPVRTGLDALTASELRVASMADAGMSNPAIAQALFVTLKTVETHLTSVYRKLGVRGRSDLSSLLPPAGQVRGEIA
jgi:DNA-binding CsgD family transcriptional regulator